MEMPLIFVMSNMKPDRCNYILAGYLKESKDHNHGKAIICMIIFVVPIHVVKTVKIM